MTNPAGLLARIFRRSDLPNAVVSSLYTQAIGRPLMVHPEIGAQLIDAYMRGAIESPEPLEAAQPGTTDGMANAPASAGKIAVLNIAGPLVDRPQPGLCDDGPLSYEAIRDAFDRSMADDSVSAIVFRMRTPGGMVDGCFDLTDHIHASRGSKPIIAVVDNMAYSAGFAIAAACDEIYVSRTGGVGSVGVFGYHVDQTEANAKKGVKVTLIYAGDHKVDFSPHVALTDEARATEQALIDNMYGMFTSAVAKYRDLSIEAVVATQAATFNGQAGIDAGFATKLGTFRDALADLAGSDEERATREAAAESQRITESRTKAAQALVAAEVAADITAALLNPDADIRAESIEARIAHAQSVVDLCTAAGDRELAREYIVQNTNIEIVRKQLQEAKAEDGPEIVTVIPESAMSTASCSLSSTDIYSRRRAAAAGTGTNPRQ